MSFFLNKTEFYWKKEGYYNDDRTISKFRVNHDHYILDLIIKKHTNDKNLLCTPKNYKLIYQYHMWVHKIKKLNNQ